MTAFFMLTTISNFIRHIFCPTGFGNVEDALKLTGRFLSIIDVRLHDNPWRMPPEAVVEQGLEAVRTYLKDVKDAKDMHASVTSEKFLKVVLVGSSRAGKTRYSKVMF